MRLRRSVIVAASLAVLGFGGVMAAYRWAYPYGQRTCFLPCVVSALVTYAVGHEDRFPDGGSTPQESLRQLTPSYVPVSMLAGISGNVAELEATIRRGGEISELQSSWVCFPGFKRTDDPRLAVIWERVGGIKFNGSRAQPGSHAVGFADGMHRQVPAAEWEAFVKEQARLRHEIQNDRKQDRANRTEPPNASNSAISLDRGRDSRARSQ